MSWLDDPSKKHVGIRPSLWQVACNIPDLAVPVQVSHADARARLEMIMLRLYAEAPDSAAREALDEAIIKLHALQPEQDARWTVLVDGYSRPVEWHLVKP